MRAYSICRDLHRSHRGNRSDHHTVNDEANKLQFLRRCRYPSTETFPADKTNLSAMMRQSEKIPSLITESEKEGNEIEWHTHTRLRISRPIFFSSLSTLWSWVNLNEIKRQRLRDEYLNKWCRKVNWNAIIKHKDLLWSDVYDTFSAVVDINDDRPTVRIP